MAVVFGLYCDGCSAVLHPVLLRNGLCRICTSAAPGWATTRDAGAEKALRYAGARLSTVGRRVVPHEPRGNRLGRPLRDGSFLRIRQEPLQAPRAGHWSEVA